MARIKSKPRQAYWARRKGVGQLPLPRDMRREIGKFVPRGPGPRSPLRFHYSGPHKLDWGPMKKMVRQQKRFMMFRTIGETPRSMLSKVRPNRFSRNSYMSRLRFRMYKKSGYQDYPYGIR